MSPLMDTSLQPGITAIQSDAIIACRVERCCCTSCFLITKHLEKRVCGRLYAKLEKTGPESYEWLKLPFERGP